MLLTSGTERIDSFLFGSGIVRRGWLLSSWKLGLLLAQVNSVLDNFALVSFVKVVPPLTAALVADGIGF